MTTRSPKSLLISGALLTTVFLAGCFGSTSSVTAPVVARSPLSPDTIAAIDSVAPGQISATDYPAPVLLDVQAILEPVRQDSVTIDGAVGGTLYNGFVRITVPPGAYAGSATIGYSMAASGALRAELHIRPDSLNHFSQPVRLTFYCHGTAIGLTPGVLWRDPAHSTWFGLTSSTYDAVGDSVSVGIRHFSTYAVGGRAGW